jgi:predicted enzyme related to lactoylglutathione lyase
MGQPVVHFEVIGLDGEKLRDFYGQLFEWEFDTSNPMDYGLVNGAGLGGGVGKGPEGYEGHVTFYVEVPDIEATLTQAEGLGATRVFGPDQVMEGLILGQFKDPEGHLIGLTQSN